MIIIANSNPILKDLFVSQADVLISEKHMLSRLYLKELNPKYVFFPFWSHFIPERIFSGFQCILFHMTDVPFGRGGSPLQNLISRGIYETKISAISVVEEIDAGPVYLKRDLSLYGTAEEIYLRAGKIIQSMISGIIENNIIPKDQEGTPVVFNRRTPEMSNLEDIDTLEKMFDYIRMLDAEDYPRAFIETSNFRFEFSRASLKSKSLLCDVRIVPK